MGGSETFWINGWHWLTLIARFTCSGEFQWRLHPLAATTDQVLMSLKIIGFRLFFFRWPCIEVTGCALKLQLIWVLMVGMSKRTMINTDTTIHQNGTWRTKQLHMIMSFSTIKTRAAKNRSGFILKVCYSWRVLCAFRLRCLGLQGAATSWIRRPDQKWDRVVLCCSRSFFKRTPQDDPPCP